MNAPRLEKAPTDAEIPMSKPAPAPYDAKYPVVPVRTLRNLPMLPLNPMAAMNAALADVVSIPPGSERAAVQGSTLFSPLCGIGSNFNA